ncbi:hypothetical protein CYMTET_14321 [Cymbomonas tetramitiformis]|uniref:Cyclic nucleotide-binding domain-containing protein n=1 Tax=Cymbomonas tetramitiformis TaxID=36881 RepID=A0AAE0GGL5_9CHLO|nr:hypothetical protein CYMTET_14321 [Cymbomonas tetramitiformis]
MPPTRPSRAVSVSNVEDRGQTLEMLMQAQGASRHFKGFSKEEATELAANVRVVNVQSGNLLMEEGDDATYSGIILSGAADVSQDGRMVETLAPGEVIGEEAIMAGHKRKARVMCASKNATLALITQEALEKITSRNPALGLKLTRMLMEAGVQNLQERIRAKSEHEANNAPSRVLASSLDKQQLKPMVEAVATSPIFKGLTAEELNVVAEKADMATFAQGEQILQAHQKSKHLMIMVKGSVDVTKENSNRSSELKNGEVLDEASFFAGRRCTANIRASADVSCIAISDSAMAEISAQHPALGAKLICNVGQMGIARIEANARSSDKAGSATEQGRQRSRACVRTQTGFGSMAGGAAAALDQWLVRLQQPWING